MLRLSASLLGAFLLCGCALWPNGSGPITPTSAEGFQAFTSIRSFDGPGRIYRVSPDGAVFGVTELNVAPRIGQEEMPHIQKTSSFSLAQILEGMVIPTTGFSLNENAALTNQRQFRTESVSGKRHYIDDSQVDGLLKNALSPIKIRTDNRYYLVRETIQTNNISYSSSADASTATGLRAGLEKVASGGLSIAWKNNEEFSLTKKFDQPMHVWYKPERIDFQRIAAIGQPETYTVRLEKDDKNLIIPNDVSRNP